MIYFAQGLTTGLVKIGTARDPEQRLRDMQATSPDELRLVRIEPGGREEEAVYHARFGHLRQHGEWFVLGEDLRAYLRTGVELDRPPREVFLTAREVANWFNLSANTILDWYERGDLPGRKFGRAVRFSMAELQAWMEMKRG